MNQKPILMSALLAAAQAHSRNLTQNYTYESFLSDNKELVILIIFFVLLTAALYLDRYNQYHCVDMLLEKTGRLVQFLRGRVQRRGRVGKEKLSGDDVLPSSKDMHTSNNIFDTQRTYVQADPSSIQQTVADEDLRNKLEAASSLELVEETPKVNLREVFDQKDGGHSSKRSKSKIKGRVQIKKSEREIEENQETNQDHETKDTQETENNKVEKQEGGSFEIGGEE